MGHSNKDIGSFKCNINEVIYKIILYLFGMCKLLNQIEFNNPSYAIILVCISGVFDSPV